MNNKFYICDESYCLKVLEVLQKLSNLIQSDEFLNSNTTIPFIFDRDMNSIVQKNHLIEGCFEVGFLSKEAYEYACSLIPDFVRSFSLEMKGSDCIAKSNPVISCYLGQNIIFPDIDTIVEYNQYVEQLKSFCYTKGYSFKARFVLLESATGANKVNIYKNIRESLYGETIKEKKAYRADDEEVKRVLNIINQITQWYNDKNRYCNFCRNDTLPKGKRDIQGVFELYIDDRDDFDLLRHEISDLTDYFTLVEKDGSILAQSKPLVYGHWETDDVFKRNEAIRQYNTIVTEIEEIYHTFFPNLEIVFYSEPVQSKKSETTVRASTPFMVIGGILGFVFAIYQLKKISNLFETILRSIIYIPFYSFIFALVGAAIGWIIGAIIHASNNNDDEG